MTGTDIITVGLSEAGNDKLDRLKEAGVFAEKIDGYRLAVAIAIAHGVAPPDLVRRTTFLNVGSLDPDQTLKITVEAMFPSELASTTPYRFIERLADWGVSEMDRQYDDSGIDFGGMIGQVEQ